MTADEKVIYDRVKKEGMIVGTDPFDTGSTDQSSIQKQQIDLNISQYQDMFYDTAKECNDRQMFAGCVPGQQCAYCQYNLNHYTDPRTAQLFTAAATRGRTLYFFYALVSLICIGAALITGFCVIKFIL